MRNFQHDIPGPFAIILQIFSGALVGVLCAGVYLVLKPVQEVDKASPPSEAKQASTQHNLVTFTPGNPGHPSGQQWRVRERAFMEKAATGVAMSETDINRWMATTYGSADRRVNLEQYGFEMQPDLPLVRIDGSELELGIVYRCKLGETKKNIVAQARGHLEKAGDRHVFKPATVYLGSCPLPGPLGEMLVDKLGAAYPVPEDVQSSWKAVTSAKVEEAQVKLAINCAVSCRLSAVSGTQRATSGA